MVLVLASASASTSTLALVLAFASTFGFVYGFSTFGFFSFEIVSISDDLPIYTPLSLYNYFSSYLFGNYFSLTIFRFMWLSLFAIVFLPISFKIVSL